AVLIVSIVLFFKPWYFLDSALSILISFIILRGVFINLMKVGKIFVQHFPEGIEREKLLNDIKQIAGVIDVHFLQGWSLDESTLNITLHIVVSGEMKMIEADNLRRQIEKHLKKLGVSLWTIQLESDGHSSRET